jgi:phage shock protein PspC (stress-responsive transcriptional regulator)
MNNNRLFRHTENKMIGGVASGLAEYLQIDVTIVRVLFVLGFFIPAPFPIVLFYIVLWIVMPDYAKRPKLLEENHPVS